LGNLDELHPNTVLTACGKDVLPEFATTELEEVTCILCLRSELAMLKPMLEDMREAVIDCEYDISVIKERLEGLNGGQTMNEELRRRASE